MSILFEDNHPAVQALVESLQVPSIGHLDIEIHEDNSVRLFVEGVLVNRKVPKQPFWESSRIILKRLGGGYSWRGVAELMLTPVEVESIVSEVTGIVNARHAGITLVHFRFRPASIVECSVTFCASVLSKDSLMFDPLVRGIKENLNGVKSDE